MSAKLSKSQLQSVLDALASANRRAQIARDKIMAHSEAVYGVVPGDVDNDSFIDACDGGAGAATGMSADDFDQTMRACMEQKGFDMPGNK